MTPTNSKPGDEKAQARELATEELDQVRGAGKESSVFGPGDAHRSGLKIGPKSLESETEDE